jgi:hypothetical protein
MADLHLKLKNGRSIVCDSAEDNPEGVSFVQVLDADGEEVAYWDSQEWADEPIEVMGAIMGALAGGNADER